jgi:hypothetical protein
MTASSVGMKRRDSVAPASSIPAIRMYRCMVFMSFQPAIFMTTVAGIPDEINCVAKHARRVWKRTEGSLLDWQKPRMSLTSVQRFVIFSSSNLDLYL